MQNIPNAFAEWLLSKDSKHYARLKTQTLSIGMQYIVDGIGFTTNWAELDVSDETSRYAAFDVPAGYKMALDFRMINPSSALWWYHVYPEGAYTLGTAKTNDPATGFIKTRNLRQDSTFLPTIATRYNITAAPTRITDSIIDEPTWGETGFFNRSNGNLAPDSTFLMLNGDQQFLLELYNGGNAAGSAQLQLNYALIPENLVSPLVV